MDNRFFYDFGKAAFGTLDMILEADAPGTVEVVIGECISGNRIDREPGGWRFINIQQMQIESGTKKYRFPLPVRPPWRKGALTSPLGNDEIAPFRYVEINGNCRVISVHRNEIFPPEFHDEDSLFNSSDEKLNQLWEFCKYSIKATAAFGLFVDGERERQPYEGDAYINQLGWFCCCANGEIPRKTIEYLLKVPTWPTEWQLLMPVMAYDYLLYTGDRKSVESWLDVLEDRLLEKWVGADKLLYTDERNPKDIVDWPADERDGYIFGKTNLVPNCYRHGALLAMEKITGKNCYREKADALYGAIRNSMFINGKFTDSPETDHSALHSKFFPLFFKVGNAGECAGIADAGMRCSVYGAQFLLDAMFCNGMEKQAMKLLCSDGERSWLNMITQGSTITMEAWSNETKPNQDWNHAWGAAPCNIIPRCIAGIRPAEPGFRKFTVDPHPVDLKEFSARFPIPQNRAIKLEYADGKMNITIPEGTSALFRNRELESGTHSVKL